MKCYYANIFMTMVDYVFVTLILNIFVLLQSVWAIIDLHVGYVYEAKLGQENLLREMTLPSRQDLR